jgi:hypothetical protein
LDVVAYEQITFLINSPCHAVYSASGQLLKEGSHGSKRHR